MKKLGFEVRTLNADDLSVQPACFANDKAELYRHLNWCMFFLENDEKSIFLYAKYGAGLLSLGRNCSIRQWTIFSTHICSFCRFGSKKGFGKGIFKSIK